MTGNQDRSARTEKNSVVPAGASANDELKKKSSGFPWRIISFSAVISYASTYMHFYGYSFIKGKITGVGHYAASISPSVNDTLLAASEGVFSAGRGLIPQLFSDENLITNCFLAAAAGFLVVLWIQFEPELKKLLSKFPKKLNKNRKRAAIGLFFAKLLGLSAFGFVLPILGALAIILAIGLLGTGLSLGYSHGIQEAQRLVESGVCVAPDWTKQKYKVTPSCLTLKDDVTLVAGITIYQDAAQSYFITGDASYHLDEKRQIISKIEFLKRPPEL